MPVTQEEIARKVGLSRQAVRLALSADLEMQRQIRPETRQRILSAVQQMGYVPHHAAQRLARAGTGSRVGFDQVGFIYLINRDIELDSVFLTILGAVEHEISRFNALLTFVRVRGDEDWQRIERLAAAGSIDAWLAYGSIDDDAIERLDDLGVRYVVLGDHRCTRPIHAVNIDHFACGRMAAEQLAAQGHRRVGFLGGSMQFGYQHETLKGFRAAAKELGLDDDPQLLFDYKLWDRGSSMASVIESNRKPVTDWVRRVRATALFCTEANWAEEMGRVLSAAQIAVPKDISLLACHFGSASRDGAFAHIRLSWVDVGHRASLLLHKIVNHPRTPRAAEKVAPIFVGGWSTGTPQVAR